MAVGWRVARRVTAIARELAAGTRYARGPRTPNALDHRLVQAARAYGLPNPWLSWQNAGNRASRKVKRVSPWTWPKATAPRDPAAGRPRCELSHLTPGQATILPLDPEIRHRVRWSNGWQPYGSLPDNARDWQTRLPGPAAGARKSTLQGVASTRISYSWGQFLPVMNSRCACPS